MKGIRTKQTAVIYNNFYASCDDPFFTAGQAKEAARFKRQLEKLLCLTRTKFKK
jgi:hypothetical protein